MYVIERLIAMRYTISKIYLIHTVRNRTVFYQTFSYSTLDI